MRGQRGKESEPFWPSVVMKKWLNIRPKLNDFSEDESDTWSEDNDGSDFGDDSFFEIHGNKYLISKSPGEKTIPPVRRLQRRKSESLRVNYISNKDVRVMTGTWNVAGIAPSDDLDLDQWLCTQEPADLYVLGFQEVVPLSAGNVFGAEDSTPIRKWEALIRQTLNRSQQPKTICKSYSAPLSPLLRPVVSGDGQEYMKSKPEDEVLGSLTHFRDWQPSTTELRCNWLYGTSSLDWPEYPLDTPSKVLIPGTGLRRVMSLGLFSTNFVEHPQGLELQGVDLQVGIRRQYHSRETLACYGLNSRRSLMY